MTLFAGSRKFSLWIRPGLEGRANYLSPGAMEMLAQGPLEMEGAKLLS